MGVRKVRATEVTCDACGASQVVTDLLDVVGFSGVVSQQGDWGETGSVKFFACDEGCLQLAIRNAIERAYER